MQDNLRLSRDEIIICYKDDVARLMQYLSWLQEKSGTVATDIYNGQGIEKSSMQFQFMTRRCFALSRK